MSFLKRRLSWGSAKSASSTGSASALNDADCQLSLDGTVFRMNNQGEWRMAKSTMGNYEAEVSRLQRYVKQLEDEKEALKERFAQEHSKRLMVEFKNELLLELLAVSQLDANKNFEALQKESVRTEALKWELGKYIQHAG